MSASRNQPIGSRESGFEPCVSLEAEIPEELFDGMREFIRLHPHWDQYRLISSALAGFLIQNGCTDSCVTQHYLNGLFMRSGQG